jgi:hypothetical protein
VTWKAERPTRFDGWTLDRVSSLCGAFPEDEGGATYQSVAATTTPPPPAPPQDFDGRTGFPHCNVTVGHVRDQTDCGACWAFAATESFNGEKCGEPKRVGGFGLRVGGRGRYVRADTHPAFSFTTHTHTHTHTHTYHTTSTLSSTPTHPMTDRRCIATNETTLLSVQDTGACCFGASCMYSNGCVGGQIGAAWNFFVRTGVVTGGDYGDVNHTDTCTPFSLAPCTHNASHVVPGHPLCPPGEYKMPSCVSTCGNAGYATPYLQDKVKATSTFKIKRYPPSLVQNELMIHGAYHCIVLYSVV